MLKSKKTKTDFDIPDYQLESLARVLLQIMREYLSSEQGQKDYAEWRQQQAHKDVGGINLCQEGK